MDTLVALVGQLLSGLRSAVAPELCPGGWAWATSLVGVGVGLLPTLGAFTVAVVRRRIGSGYGGGRGALLAGLGLVTAGLLPLLVFVAAGRVFAAAAAEANVPGLSAAAERSLGTTVCFVGPQSTYLGGASVADAFDPADPVGLGVAILLLGLVPLVTALFVGAQARLVLRRGPAWPARFFWLPALALAVATAGVPAGAAEHLWAGALVGAFVGMVLLIAVPPPSRETVRRSTQPRTVEPRPDLRERMQPIIQRTPPVETGPKPRYAGFDSAKLPTAPPARQPVPQQRAAAPLAAEPGVVPPLPGRGPTGTRVAPVPGASPAPPPFAAPLPGPTRAGGGQRFRLIERIGAGGFGRVWLAHDAKLGRTVALKSAHAPDAETEERIRREAAALAAVRHPLCVQVHDLVHARSDAGLTQLDGLVIVMEHVQGVPLSKLVQDRGPVDDVAAARIWTGVAGALDAAHHRGVLHRDLKPGNVIVDPAGHPHLIDFGIARRTGDSTLTMTGFVLGTPDYLAPEVAAGGKASNRSDVWQLAATVSFALTGYPPRGGHADALSGLRAAASGARLTHLPRRTAHLPLLKQALRSDPNRRPDLAATQRQLEEWLRRNGVPAVGPAVSVGIAPVVTAASPRIAGIDAARGVALLGMMATHVLPLRTATGETVVGAVAAGRASALFAVLLGVGIALGSRVTDLRSHLAAGAGLLVRAALTGLVGLVLVGLDPPVAVILTYYALLIVVAIPLLRAPFWLLAGGSVVAGVVAPVLSHLWRSGPPDGPGAQVGFAELTDPGAALVTLLVTGYYPVLTWTAYLLAGLAAGRLDLRSSRTGWGLLGGGAVLAVGASVLSSALLAGSGLAAIGGPRELLTQRYGTVPTDTWWWLAAELPHSGTPLELAQSTGSALAVLGAMLLLAQAVPWAVVPFAAIGAVPLTLYALHVASLAALGGEGRPTYLWHVGWCLVIGLVVRALGVRGPAEAVVSGASRAVRGSAAAMMAR